MHHVVAGGGSKVNGTQKRHRRLKAELNSEDMEAFQEVHLPRLPARVYMLHRRFDHLSEQHMFEIEAMLGTLSIMVSRLERAPEGC